MSPFSGDPRVEGLRLFKQGRFADAVIPLRIAAAIDRLGAATLLLSHRFMQVHHPPARTPLDGSIVGPVRAELRPDNDGAIHALASLAIVQGAWEECQRLYKQLIEHDPQDAAATYGLAYVLLQPWWPDYENALTVLGMSHEDPGGHTGPFREPVRSELRAKHWAAIDRGLELTRRALEINARFDGAMGMMSNLLRARAYLHQDVQEFRRDREAAHEWLMRSLQMRQRNRMP